MGLSIGSTRPSALLSLYMAHISKWSVLQWEVDRKSVFKLLLLCGTGVPHMGADCGSRLVNKIVGETISESIGLIQLLLFESSSMTVTSISDDTGVAAKGVAFVLARVLLLFAGVPLADTDVISRCLLGLGLSFSFKEYITLKH